jgi:hypothetical protein
VRGAAPAARSAFAALLLCAAAPPAAALELRASVPADAVAETVFSSGACETWDTPDSPARAWRAADGTVRLIAAHVRNRVAEAPTLDGPFARGCSVVFAGGRRDDPAAHDDHQWLVSPWSPDGRTVYGIVHDEFHGHRRPDLCPAAAYMACWRNVLAFTRSEDGGRSFDRPARFLAGLPYRYDGLRGRRQGLFAPSNVVSDGPHRYVFAFAEAQGAQPRGVCLLRTDDVSDPASWRAWDGEGFSVRMPDPYAREVDDPAAHACAPIDPAGLPFTVSSVVRHRDSGLWLAVMSGRRAERPGGAPRTGIWASSSPDLVTWSAPRLVLEAPILTSRDCAVAREAVYYPSVLDPDARTRNFEDADGTAHLFLTRMSLDDRCRPGPDRDLIRLPLEIAVVEDGAAATRSVPVETPFAGWRKR